MPVCVQHYTEACHRRIVNAHVHVGVLCCFALFVCLTLLASFFLPSHLSFKNMYMYLYNLVITVHCMYKIQLQFHVMICCLLCVYLQVWANKSQLPGDHVTAGSFETAMRVSQCCSRHAVYVLYIYM